MFQLLVVIYQRCTVLVSYCPDWLPSHIISEIIMKTKSKTKTLILSLTLKGPLSEQTVMGVIFSTLMLSFSIKKQVIHFKAIYIKRILKG
jgi:hypothetical protein